MDLKVKDISQLVDFPQVPLVQDAPQIDKKTQVRVPSDQAELSMDTDPQEEYLKKKAQKDLQNL